jgi:hypothetical protein
MIVTKEFYDLGGRKYIDLDNVRIKIPWRYNRVMCEVKGLVTIQELRLGQSVDAQIEKRMWDNEAYLVLKTIRAEEADAH